MLLLTARVDAHDQIAGLETGANDYRIKLLGPRLLIARARTLLRRMQPAPTAVGAPPVGDALRSGEIVASPPNRKITWRGEMLKALRGIEFDGLNHSVNSSISRVRRRFETSSEPRKVKTIWRRGDLFSPSAWEK